MTISNASPLSELERLERHISDLRVQPAPSTQLIDALNALAKLLSSVDIERALTASKEAHTLSYLLRHHAGVAVSLARLSWLHLEVGTFDTAVLEAHEAQFLAEQIGDYVLITRAVYVLATAQRMAGNYSKAKAHWQHLLNLAREQADLAREADFYNALGDVFEDERDYLPALDHYQRAHEIYVKIGDDAHVTAKNNVADMMSKLGRHEEALAWAESALQSCDPARQVWRAFILHTLGVAHMYQRQYDLARREFNESRAMSLQPSGRKITGVKALIDIARLELLHNRIATAFDALDQAIALARDIKAVPQQIEAHQTLFRLYLTAHDTANADAHHEAYLALQSQIEMERMDRRMGLIRAEAAVERQRPVWMRESQQLTRGPFSPTLPL